MQRDTRLGIVLAAAAVLLTLGAAEVVLTLQPEPGSIAQRVRKRAVAAAALGLPSDDRTQLAVVAALRAGGADAWPSVSSGILAGVPGDTGLLPLAGVSSVLTVLCNEVGPYVTYLADEHGFTNPAGAWSAARTDVALVGDSYVQGHCVSPDRSFAALIRQRYPATLVAGVGSGGPLKELGFLREYLAPRQPRVVLWFYYEGNDLTDLSSERRVARLARYLEPGYSQGLASRQADVDAKLKAYVAATEAEASRYAAAPRPGRITAVLKLKRLRALVRALRAPPPPCCSVGLFERVLRQAEAEASGWRGRLVLVYLPSRAALAGGRAARQPPMNAMASVDSVARRAGIAVLNLRDSLPRFGPVDSLYWYEGSHLSDRGHAAVAEIVTRYLDGLPGLSRAASPPR